MYLSTYMYHFHYSAGSVGFEVFTLILALLGAVGFIVILALVVVLTVVQKKIAGGYEYKLPTKMCYISIF